MKPNSCGKGEEEEEELWGEAWIQSCSRCHVTLFRSKRKKNKKTKEVSSTMPVDRKVMFARS